MSFKNGTVLGGSLLVAGTTIGGGMLALPVLTSPGGFIPSLLIYIACWLFMSLTGLLFLEIALNLHEDANIVSMAEKTFGFFGKMIAWGLYLFLFYCLTVAYLVGCGDIITSFFYGAIPRVWGPLIFCIFFGPFVYVGTKLIGRLNIFLMFILAALYVAFVILGFSEIQINNLIPRHWGLALLGLPVAFTSFAYQGIIPTLITYLDRDPAKIRTSIWLGTTIPLITYIIWQGLILGIVPFEGPHGLKDTLEQGYNAVHPLKNFLNNPYIFVIGQYFAFLALLTSFFGVTLGLLDFLSDGLSIKKTTSGRLLLCGLIFIPPLLIATSNPDIFLQALDYAGGYGCSLLLGLLPVCMAAKMRPEFPKESHQVGGGNIVLALLAGFVLFELAIEIIF